MGATKSKQNMLLRIRKMLNFKWKRLEKKYSDKKGRILFALLFMINCKFPLGEAGVNEKATSSAIGPFEFRLLLRTLDELLMRGWKEVDFALDKKETIEYAKIVSSEFSTVGILRNALLAIKKIRFRSSHKNHSSQNISKLKSELESAFNDWWEKYELDVGWADFYGRKSKKTAEITDLVRRGLEEKYGITHGILHSFGRNMKSKIEYTFNQLKSEGETNFISFYQSQLAKMIAPEIERYDERRRKAISRLAKAMYYSPDKNWLCSPFIRVINSQNSIIIPIYSAFYPDNAFFDAWIERTAKRSSSPVGGKMGQDWGDVFEEYVQSIIRKSCPHLTIDSCGMRFKPSDFPDMKQCLGQIRKTEIEIDIIAHSTEEAYLMSCKSLDQFARVEQVRNLRFLRLDRFEEEIERDIEMAGEIEDYANCIQQSSIFLESKGFEEKDIVPMLVTSDFRPLSLESVRNWLPKYRIIPDVQIIQANNLVNYFAE